MSYPAGGYAPYSQYGTTNNQFATTYTPADQSQTQYAMPAYNPYATAYQENAAHYNPYTAPYAQGNSSYDSYGQSNTQDGGLHTSSAQDRQYSQVAPPYNSDRSSFTSREAPPPSYDLPPPPLHNQPPAPLFSQGPPTLHSQQPASSYNQAAPPTYNQAPPPTHIENSNTYQHHSDYQQRPTQPHRPAYLQGASYPQHDPAYQQYPSSHAPNYQQGSDHHSRNANYGPTNSPNIGPQRAPKRPHMPDKLQTHFKQPPKKIAANPPQPMTSMQPLQGGKSAVSSVHDIAFQNGYTINWYEQSETGPAHAKVFSMKVTMGPYEVLGSGRSKKLAKQDAAQLLIAQVTGNTVADIMGLPGFTGNTCQTGNTSEDYGPQLPQDAKPNSSVPSRDDNPISMLDHVAKKHHLGEPQYTTVCENGPLALQRFDIKVSLNNMEASGLGRSKKVAKRNAAQAMLDQLSRKNVGIKAPKKRIMFVKASSDSSTNEI